ncbi:hypothetical protein V8E54_003287 [Elaphomyces granulatus]|jgi:uncharacterized protein (DUF427 family)
MALDALLEALEKDEYLLNQMVRMVSCMKLQSMATQLQPLSASFVTFSAADHQWDDLLPYYEDFSTGAEQIGNQVAFKNVKIIRISSRHV